MEKLGCGQDKKLINFHSIRFKTWLYFFFSAIFIIAIMLMVQLVLFGMNFSRMKKQEVERVGDSVVDTYKTRRNNFEFKEYVYQTAYTNAATITFFKIDYTVTDGVLTIDYDSAVDLLSSDRYSGGGVGQSSPEVPGQELSFLDTSYFNYLEENETAAYVVNTERGQYVVYGAKIQDNIDGQVFLCMLSPLNTSEFMVSVLRKQSFLVTIFCALISLIVSYFLANRVAGPISSFSKVAKRLGSGDYSVRFYGNGMTEFDDLASTLNHATEEMGKTEQLRRDLLANVSHDLRTPLTMVKAYAEMIRDLSGQDAKKRTSHSQTIIDEADRLTNLVNDIQNLSKLQSGTEGLERTVFDLASLTKSVLERFCIYTETEGFVFKQEMENNSLIEADEKKIEQVLYNLVGNAINYTGQDKTVTVFVREKNDKIFFGVKDTGKGISADEVDTVWERYYRAGQTKRTHVGTGLGLSIVKNILDLHGAKYGVETKIDAGSTFWFSLPKHIKR